MQIHLNARNIGSCLIILGFIYLAFIIWGADDTYDNLEVDIKDVMSYAVLAVETGGRAVKKIFDEKALGTSTKGTLDDVGKKDMLTKADLVSNTLIMELLERYHGLHIISEEAAGGIADAEVESYREEFAVNARDELWNNVKDFVALMPSKKIELSRLNVWIDPLDATQEYTEGLTEFVTTMACVTVDGKPVFGAIYRPFFDETVMGLIDWGVASTKRGKITFDDNQDVPKKVMVSRSHAGTVKELVDKAFNNQYEVEPAGGSGYKTLRLINSTAEIYMHSTTIKKWDLCAPDALIRAAGGAMIDLEGRPIDYTTGLDVYNKKGLFVSRKNTYSKFMQIKDYVKI